jgi:hypothetical protein
VGEALGSTVGVGDGDGLAGAVDAMTLGPDDAAGALDAEVVAATPVSAGTGSPTAAWDRGARNRAAATAPPSTATVAAAEAPPFPLRNIRHIITRAWAVESNPPHAARRGTGFGRPNRPKDSLVTNWP